MKIIMSQWLSRWWWVIAFPIAIQLLLGLIHNIVFLYTAFITIFLILPPLFLFLYYFYALTPEARISIQDKHIVFQDDGINIIFENYTEEQNVSKPMFIEIKNIRSAKFTEKYILLMLGNNKYSNITIPYSAIADENQLQEIATLINTNRNNN